MADDITAERLAEIRARAKSGYYGTVTTAVLHLLAAIDARDEEIERLRGEPTDAPCLKYEQVWQAWHDTDQPWGGCGDRENLDRVMELVETFVCDSAAVAAAGRSRRAPTDAEVEAGARAGYNLDRVRYANPGRFYDEIPEESRQIVRDTARAVLTAAREVRHG